MGVLGPQSAQKKGDTGSKGVLGGGGPQVMGGRGGGESGSRGCQRLGSRGKGAKGEGARSDRVPAGTNRGQKLRARGHGGAPPSLSLPSPPPLSLCSRRFPAPAPPLPAGEGVRGPLAHGGAQRSAAPGAHRGTGTPRGWAGLDGTERGRSRGWTGRTAQLGTARLRQETGAGGSAFPPCGAAAARGADPGPGRYVNGAAEGGGCAGAERERSGSRNRSRSQSRSRVPGAPHRSFRGCAPLRSLYLIACAPAEQPGQTAGWALLV